MQVNSVNSVNFKGSNMQPAFTSNINNPSSDFNNFAQAADIIDKAVSKANQNVHVSTVLATIGTAVAAGATLMQVVPLVRKGAVKSAEVITSSVVKTGNSVVNLFRKNKVQPENIKSLNTISSVSKKLINGAEIQENGFSKGVTEMLTHVQDVIGVEKTEKLESAMKNFGLKNGVGLFDAAVAGTIAYKSLDPVSDAVENVSDRNDISKAVEQAKGLSRTDDADVEFSGEDE